MEPFFQQLSHHTSVPVDQLKCIVLLFLGYPLGVVYHYGFHPDHTHIVLRHVFTTSIGLLFGLMCFGWVQMGILFSMTGVCYTMLLLVPTKMVHIYTIVFAMTFMSVAHIYQMMVDYGGWHFDFTAPSMLIVQRVTLVAFALHDGVACKEVELNEDQKQMKLMEVPSLLEYWSYNYNFHTFLVGPICTMKEYLNFVDGSNFNATPTQNGNRKTIAKPSALYPVINTLLGSLMCAAIYLVLSVRYPLDTMLEPGHSLVSRVLITHLALTHCRAKYYFVWLLAESVNNYVGLGFSGYDKEGEPVWDVCKNIRVFDVEFATNAKMLITGWNVTGSLWLRRVCYERVPPKIWISPHSATFVLSSIWHGFYPGYYLSLVTFMFVNEAARKMRKLLRHHFQTSPAKRCLYDLATIVATALSMHLAGSCFQLLMLDRCILFWSYFYFVPMVVVVMVSFIPIPGEHGSKGKTLEKTH